MARTQRIRVKGFTLVELLVVISIIALLISILLPSLKRARDQAKDTLCRANLKQLGVANMYYASDNNDRMMWIQGTGPTHSIAPFRQVHQLFQLWPYLKERKLYQCPRAKSARFAVRRPNAPPTKPGGLPGSVTGYAQGKGGGKIGYYNAMTSDSQFLELWQQRAFPDLSQAYLSTLSGTDPIPQIYTEYWFNDWNEGASNQNGDIPAISGNLINHIPQPEYAVVMCDAVDWNPRHNGGNFFLFLDTHVERISEEKYYDPKGPGSGAGYVTKDKDPFGNYPFYAWGLGKDIFGYDQ